MGVYVKWIISIIVILILVTFGTENNQTVQLKYYIDSLTIGLPQYVLVYAAIIILGFGMSKLPYRRNTMPVAAFHGLSKIGVCLRFRG
jgi:uncharacterized integral membrane protein